VEANPEYKDAPASIGIIDEEGAREEVPKMTEPYDLRFKVVEGEDGQLYAKRVYPIGDVVDTKDTNPKDRIGSSKLPLDLIPATASIEEALAFLEGAEKYGAFNYRAVGVRASIYVAAAMRHIQKWVNGEERDEKTGVHHLGSARACLGILLDAQSMDKLTDDRPPASPEFSRMVDEAQERVEHIKELFKDKDPKHYTIDDKQGESQ